MRNASGGFIFLKSTVIAIRDLKNGRWPGKHRSIKNRSCIVDQLGEGIGSSDAEASGKSLFHAALNGVICRVSDVIPIQSDSRKLRIRSQQLLLCDGGPPDG